jgi:carbonic anhydrase
VPANEIVGLLPGELFVHRNVGNLVVHTDLNCLSVLQYAVDVLHVEHVIVCGHYGCGGIAAANRGRPLGLIDNWLRHIQDIAERHRAALEGAAEESERCDRLTEINVLEQAFNVCRTTIVREAWRKGDPLEVHAWIYHLTDGLLQDLKFSASKDAEPEAELKKALARLEAGRKPPEASQGTGEPGKPDDPPWLAPLMVRGQEQGYLTYADVFGLLPADIVYLEEVEDIVDNLSKRGIAVYDKAPDAEPLPVSEPATVDGVDLEAAEGVDLDEIPVSEPSTADDADLEEVEKALREAEALLASFEAQARAEIEPMRQEEKPLTDRPRAALDAGLESPLDRPLPGREDG